MKKQTIWILAILMVVTFMGLLFMQIFYMRNMVQMRNAQFAQAIRQSMLAVSLRLSHDETEYYLEEDVDNISSSTLYGQYIGEATPRLGGLRFQFTTSSGLEGDLTIKGAPSEISNIQINSGRRESESPVTVGNNKSFQERYRQQKGLIDDIILDILSQTGTRPIEERADSAKVRKYLRQELDTLGLDVPFEFELANRSGNPVYQTAGFRSASNSNNTFSQVLFPHHGPAKSYFLNVCFPTHKDIIFSTLHFIIPSFVFTFVLLIVFIFTIITAFRQKKLTEMKNDFINNMTHEFKTPISSISLAAQMLNDQSVRKSPAMLQQISNVINDETKRLRFQVEKVLQMSMFEGRKATLKLQEVDANLLIYNIVNTFKLKVEKYGGQLCANLDAMDAIVEVDEMHFTNVIFNLLDNAVKYRREDVPLNLSVFSRNISDDKIEIIVEDNGIGISREDQKRIFEKFYRVSTGNRHDVKGFGLGLAYVHKMIIELGGEISVESHLNQGTKFIIILPLSKN